MKQDRLFTQLGLFLPLFIYTAVNGLFIVKYGSEFPRLNNYVLLAGYLILIVSTLFFFEKTQLPEVFFQYLHWITVICFFIFTVFLNEYVKLESLKVDRLDALDSGIKAVLNGDYPYDIVNRLGNESSNLPVLIIIGIPFYLLFGSAAYLQSFCFLLFSYIIFKYFKTYRNRVLALLLLILSPGYLYELYVKSDLLSNFIIAAGFVLLIWNYYLKSPVMKLPYVALLAGLVVLTRIPVVFALAVVLFKKFVSLSTKSKIIFSTVFLGTLFFILSIFMLMAPNIQLLTDHNPFRLQSKQPVLLSLLLLIIAVICSFIIKTLPHIMAVSGVILFSSVFISFIIAVNIHGFQNIYFGSYFDISHFNMALPFLILSLASGGFFNGRHSAPINIKP